MQHTNDDMDELFRKAADEYPLNIGVPDWNKVAMGLSEATEPARVVPQKRYRRFLWLLLLIPIGFIVKEIADPGLFKSIAGADNQKSQNQGPGGEQGKRGVEPNGPSATRDHNSAGTFPVARDGSAAREPGEEEDNRASDDAAFQKPSKNRTSGDPASINDVAKSNGNQGTTNTGKKPVAAGTSTLQNNSPDQTNINPGTTNRKNSKSGKLASATSGVAIAKNDSKSSSAAFGKNGNSTIPGNSTVTGNSTVAGNRTVPGNTADYGDIDREIDETNVDPYLKTGLVPFSASPDISIVPAPQMTSIQPGPITTQRPKRKNFYLGAVGGLDFTTVKFQEISKTGNHFGGIAGYSFARKWSVEVGFLVEKKYYYSDGQYFDRSKLNLNANTSIVSVDGDCKMFEIPVSVKYDITNTYRSNFFVTGGLSTYIMKQEDYKLVYGYPSGSTSTHYYPYKNSSKNFFAEIRLTGGYAWKLPKQFSVRLEPYLNIPVSGVGYGNLNLMSAGINAGVFRRIF